MAGRVARCPLRRAKSIPDHGIGLDRTGDVLEGLLTEVGEFNLDLSNTQPELEK